jgi:hypothetical protein
MTDSLPAPSCRYCAEPVEVAISGGGCARLAHVSRRVDHDAALGAGPIRRRRRLIADHGDHLAVYVDRGPGQAWTLIGAAATRVGHDDAVSTARRWAGHGEVPLVPVRGRAPATAEIGSRP